MVALCVLLQAAQQQGFRPYIEGQRAGRHACAFVMRKAWGLTPSKVSNVGRAGQSSSQELAEIVELCEPQLHKTTVCKQQVKVRFPATLYTAAHVRTPLVWCTSTPQRHAHALARQTSANVSTPSADPSSTTQPAAAPRSCSLLLLLNSTSSTAEYDPVLLLLLLLR